MQRFESLTKAFEKLLNLQARTVVARSLDELKAACKGACLVRLEASFGSAELLVKDGTIVAARARLGERLVSGNEALEAAGRMLPGIALVYELPERLLEWRDEEFTVYIRGIDLQHKQLVKLFNNLYRALLEDKPAYAFEAVNFMREYAGFHFRTEERLFEKYGYPKAEEHREQHAYFIKEVERFANMLREVETPDAALEMLGFLAHWIRVHIQGSDREYGKWLREKGLLEKPQRI